MFRCSEISGKIVVGSAFVTIYGNVKRGHMIVM